MSTRATPARSTATGQNISLRDGAVVEPGAGCEWIIAVFSDEPLDVREVMRAARKAGRTRASCGLDLQIDNARTVSVLPVTR